MALAVPLALAVTYAVTFVDYPLVDRGWTADHLVHQALQFVRGEEVWADPRGGSPTAFMYPPGFAWLLAPLVALFGPALWTARVLSWTGSLVLLVVLVRETARRTGDRRLAWCAPGLLALVGLAHGRALLLAHPEAPALALGVLTLVAARHAAERRRGLLLPVVLACAAVLVKQTALVFVLAAAAPLAAQRPARALRFLLAVGVVLAVLFAWGQLATQGRLLEYLLLAREHRLQPGRLPGLLLYLGYYLGPWVPVMAGAALLVRPRTRPAELLRDPFLVAFVLLVPGTLLVMLKDTSAANNLLPLCALAVPLVLQAAGELRARLLSRPVLAALAALAVLAWATWRNVEDAPRLLARLRAHDEGLAAAQRLDELVARAPRPVWIPTDLSLAWRHDVPVTSPAAILFEFRHDPRVRRPLLERLRAREFAMVLVPDGLGALLPAEEFEPLLRAGYLADEVVRSSPSIGAYTTMRVFVRRE